MDEFSVPPQAAAIWCPHVTVACVIADGDRFLMVEEDIRGTRQFNQPAGHLEPGESLAEAAVRETLEETGWDVALDCFVGVQQWHSPVHAHEIVRFAFAGHPVAHHPERNLDAGIVRALWMSYAEIAALGERLRSPLVLTSLADWLAGQRLPLASVRSLLPPSAGA
ncbi:MAG TPA: NUDIX hydrolase [Rhodanobacteraceae bacterium]|jgi:8-oxo-dGTP pyrophosphatase MutT (NUDIX family)|nr:NUDIX hydrolase [Rhodanobacteraceae bacterium]